MQWIGEAWRRLTFFFRCGQFQGELKEEMDEHVRMKAKDLADEGMPPDEARNAARREFGNALLLREKSRDPWGFRWLETLLQDLRYGLRQLRRNPGFAAVAIITLALGIGANTAVFSVVDSVLLRQISYRDASRLVWLTNYDLYFKQDDYGPLGDYRIWKKQARSFESMTAYGNEDLTLMTDRGAAQERIASITGDFWSITGAHPALGRLFGPAEQHTMVLSHTLFERRFGSDPHIIGTTVTLNGYPFTVTGVLQPKFRFLFPQQFSVDEPRDIDAYIPFPNAVVAPGNPIYFPGEAEKYGPAPSWVCVVGKLRSHVAIATARAQMETIYARIAREYPTPGHKITILHFVPLQQKLVAGVRPALLVLLGAVGFVLLIATSNVANLLLARASTRQREMAIRTAIGAGRLRIIRQLLAESILLALIGGVAGLLLARWALAVIVRVGSDVIPGAAQTTIDGRVLLFALGTSVMTGILFGLAPALSFWRGNLHDALKDNARPASASTGGLRMLRLLVTAQLALATVLLTGAGLMLKSFWRMNTYPPGFVPRKVLVMRIPFSGPKYKAWLREDEYIRQLIRRVGAIPGVEAVGIDRSTFHIPFKVAGARNRSPGYRPVAAFRYVSPGYLRALGAPLVMGTWPRNDDAFDSLIVNEAFARSEFGSGDPIGHRLTTGFLSGTIVGVVADFKYWQLDAQPSPQVYVPYQLSPLGRSVRVLVRTEGDPKEVAPTIRKVASSIDPTQPLYEFQTLQQALSNSIAPRRFNLLLLATFAAVALVMALVGIHGVISYSVTQRTHEMGIRMALGAERNDVLRLVVGQGMTLVLAGVSIGTAGALALTRFISSLLYDVKPTDAATFVFVSLVFTCVALFACYIPAHRATKVDPMVALRYE